MKKEPLYVLTNSFGQWINFNKIHSEQIPEVYNNAQKENIKFCDDCFKTFPNCTDYCPECDNKLVYHYHNEIIYKTNTQKDVIFQEQIFFKNKHRAKIQENHYIFPSSVDLNQINVIKNYCYYDTKQYKISIYESTYYLNPYFSLYKVKHKKRIVLLTKKLNIMEIININDEEEKIRFKKIDINNREERILFFAFLINNNLLELFLENINFLTITNQIYNLNFIKNILPYPEKIQTLFFKNKYNIETKSLIQKINQLDSQSQYYFKLFKDLKSIEKLIKRKRKYHHLIKLEFHLNEISKKNSIIIPTIYLFKEIVIAKGNTEIINEIFKNIINGKIQNGVEFRHCSAMVKYYFIYTQLFKLSTNDFFKKFMFSSYYYFAYTDIFTIISILKQNNTHRQWKRIFKYLFQEYLKVDNKPTMQKFIEFLEINL